VAPHFPQFDVSLESETQEPPQLVFVPHSVVQTPALQTMPLPHAVAQFPQWFTSDCTFTHAAPHTVYPELHATPQVAALQTAVPFGGVGQTLPHLPQLATSEVSGKQLEPHGE